MCYTMVLEVTRSSSNASAPLRSWSDHSDVHPSLARSRCRSDRRAVGKCPQLSSWKRYDEASRLLSKIQGSSRYLSFKLRVQNINQLLSLYCACKYLQYAQYSGSVVMAGWLQAPSSPQHVIAFHSLAACLGRRLLPGECWRWLPACPREWNKLQLNICQQNLSSSS